MEKVREGKVIKIAGYVKPNTITLMDESHMEFVIIDIKDKDKMVESCTKVQCQQNCLKMAKWWF